MNKIKTIIISAVSLTCMVGCSDFLAEHPKTFLTPDNYFTTGEQMQAAVDGIYPYLADILNGDIEVGTNRYVFLEYLAGYSDRPRSASGTYMEQARYLTITEENNNVEALWKTAYTAIENINSAIAGIEGSTADVAASLRNQLLGEAYFMRAYHYFNLVRLWGPVPMKLTPTTDLSNVEIALSSESEVFGQIEKDLLHAEELMADLAWNNASGHVGLGTVKSLLSKVYITMAGYPLSLGKDYYTKAYDKASEVYDKGTYQLYSSYAEMRDNANSNAGEWILCIQREADKAGSPLHNSMLPYPEVADISKVSTAGGAMSPTLEFYNSYSADDLRKQDYGYYTTKGVSIADNSEITLDRPYIYKFWDKECASTGKSGVNYPLMRYADVLLTLAEAKVMADGGRTSDTKAIDAWFKVRHRALPDEARPSSLDFDTVFKERIWELSFETQLWFDLLRTRKVYVPASAAVEDLVGAKVAGHLGNAFEAEDLLFPYPLRESRLNPNLKR